MEITEKLPEFWAHVKDNQRTDLKLNNPGSPLTKYFTLLYDPRYEVWYYVYELTIDRCLLERTEGYLNINTSKTTTSHQCVYTDDCNRNSVMVTRFSDILKSFFDDVKMNPYLPSLKEICSCTLKYGTVDHLMPNGKSLLRRHNSSVQKP